MHAPPHAVASIVAFASRASASVSYSWTVVPRGQNETEAHGPRPVAQMARNRHSASFHHSR
jgi:hypothetical protein